MGYRPPTWPPRSRACGSNSAAARGMLEGGGPSVTIIPKVSLSAPAATATVEQPPSQPPAQRADRFGGAAPNVHLISGRAPGRPELKPPLCVSVGEFYVGMVQRLGEPP